MSAGPAYNSISEFSFLETLYSMWILLWANTVFVGFGTFFFHCVWYLHYPQKPTSTMYTKKSRYSSTTTKTREYISSLVQIAFRLVWIVAYLQWINFNSIIQIDTTTMILHLRKSHSRWVFFYSHKLKLQLRVVLILKLYERKYSWKYDLLWKSEANPV